MFRIIYNIQKRFKRGYGRGISYGSMMDMIRNNRNIWVIDVRTKDEYGDKHLEGAINIPLQDIEKKIEEIVPDRNSVIIVYCQHGGRGQKALSKLIKIGYENVYNLDGGLDGR